jgi:hypothetical protein
MAIAFPVLFQKYSLLCAQLARPGLASFAMRFLLWEALQHQLVHTGDSSHPL